MKYELKDVVSICVSGETGEVIGRAEYKNSESTYLLRYKDADGTAVEKWWSESALKLVLPNEEN